MPNHKNENSLLSSCAKYPLGSWNPSEFSQTLQFQLDWPYLLRTAGAHGLTPLLFRSLLDTDEAKQLPPNIVETLRASYLNVVMQNQRQLLNIAPVLRSFSQNSIPVILLKGPALGMSVYSDIGLRPFGDVDILVPLDRLDLSKSLLGSLGYRILPGGYFPIPDDRNEELGCEWTYVKDGFVVELHWDLISKLVPLSVDLPFYWNNSRKIEVQGEPALIMGPESQFLHLCLHQFKHHWKHLRDLTDIALIVDRFGEEMNWPAIAVAARKQGLGRCVYFNLYLAERVLGTSAPRSFVNDLLGAGHPTRATIALANMLAQNILESRLPRIFWELPLVKGVGGKAKVIANIMAHLFHSTDNNNPWKAARKAENFTEKIGVIVKSIVSFRGVVSKLFSRLLLSFKP